MRGVPRAFGDGAGVADGAVASPVAADDAHRVGEGVTAGLDRVGDGVVRVGAAVAAGGAAGTAGVGAAGLPAPLPPGWRAQSRPTTLIASATG